MAGTRASVHAKLLGAFLLIGLLFVAMGAMSLQTMAHMSRQSRLLGQGHERVDASRQIQRALAMQMNFTALALLLRDEQTIESILRENNRFNNTLTRLEEAAPPAEREAIRQIRMAQDEVLVGVADIANFIREGKFDAAMALHLETGYPLYQRVERLVSQVVQMEEDEMAVLRRSVGTANRRALVLAGTFVGAALALALLLGFVISWSVIQPLREAGGFLSQVARGNFDAVISVTNRDEFGVLAEQMNRMSGELHRLYEDQSVAAEQLQALNEKLERASRAKSDFLANMSHELRTPLNAIIGYSEMLQEDAGDFGGEPFVADLQKINAAGKHLLELVNAVLDLSKIEAGKMELYLETFSVAAVVREVVAVVQPLVERNANRLEVECSEGVGAMRADVTKVRQALLNVLSNACKFTEKGMVSLTVVRETGAEGEWLTFRVRDTGIGMTSAQVSRLFQEFSQAEASTTRRYGGTGLGLALSRRLCRMMGGDITVASEPNRGSTFTLRLPANVAEVSAEAATRPEAVEPDPSARAGSVLVIDDEAVVRDLMRRVLGREGFRVLTAAGGAEGLALAKKMRPDAITLDVIMAGMDGWAVLSALKADPEVADIPVIMLTIVDDKNLGYTLGASDYLTKPADRDRLMAILRKYRPGDRPVLLVDDDRELRELMRRMLEKEGCVVMEAENGVVALERVRESRPALILLDLVMPEMDGFEFIDELRRHAPWREIPVVVVTSKDLSEEERLRLNGHVQKVLQKEGHSRDALLRELRSIVSASIQRRGE